MKEDNYKLEPIVSNHSSLQNEIEISIIIEWENILLSEEDRCHLMLVTLQKQLDEINRTVEVLVLFNPEQIGCDVIKYHLHRRLHSRLELENTLRIEEAKGKHYYELKNEGACKAKGKIIVYLDSDVVPEKKWLKEITQPFFDNRDIEVLAGHTYLTHETLPQKAFALGWFFPLRNSEDTLSSDKKGFYANNVAFRRETILQFPFPEMPEGVTRGACTALTKTLFAAGVPIWTNTAARASHPPPASFQHYLTRAFAHGRDNVIRWQKSGRSLSSILYTSFQWSVRRIKKTTNNLIKKRDSVQLSIWQTPFAFSIMTGFYSCAFCGSCLTLLFPNYASKHWKI